MKTLTVRCLLGLVFSVLLAQYGVGQVNIDLFYKKGLKAFWEDENYHAAITHLNTVLKYDTTNADAYLLRGLSKQYLFDDPGAIEDFTKAIINDSFLPHAYLHRGISKTNLQNYYSALTDFNKALERTPHRKDIYVSIGYNLIQIKQYNSAIDALKLALAEDPEYSRAYLQLGVAYTLTGNYTAAEKNFEKAIKNSFLSETAFIKKGTMHLMQEDFNSAIEDFSAAIKRNADNPDSYLHRAYAFIQMEDMEAAKSDLNKAISIDPENVQALYQRGLILLEEQNYEFAIKDLKKVATLRPQNVINWYYLGHAYYLNGELDFAIANFSKAIDIFPRFTSAYLNRAYIYEETGMISKAQADYSIARSLNKNLLKDTAYNKSTKEYFQKLIGFDNPSYTPMQYFEQYFDKSLFSADICLDPIEKLQGQEFFFSYKNSEIKYNSKDPFTIIHQNLDFNSIENYQEANLILSPHSDSSIFYFLYGLIHQQKGNYRKSLTFYDKAIELNPLLMEAYLNKGNVLFIMLQTGITGIDEEKKYFFLEPPSETTHHKSYVEKIQQIQRLLQLAIQLAPEAPYLYYNYGVLCISVKDYPEAVSYFSKAIECDNEYATAYFHRALSLILLSQPDACADLSKAGSLGVEQAYKLIESYCRQNKDY